MIMSPKLSLTYPYQKERIYVLSKQQSDDKQLLKQLKKSWIRPKIAKAGFNA